MGNDTSEFSDEDLSGPVIEPETTRKLLDSVSRRSAIKALASAGIAGLAGCSGQGGGEGTATSTETQQQTETATEAQGGGQQTTATETQTQQKSKRYSGRLTAAWNADKILRLDPHLLTQAHEGSAAGNVFSSIVRLTPKLKAVGDLAKDWSFKNATDFRVTLRDNIKWQNGYGEVTAQDFQFNVKRGMTLKGSQAKTNFKRMVGATKGNYSEAVEIHNDKEFTIHLKEPFGAGVVILGTANWVCPPAVKEMGRDEYLKAPVGSGPFKINKHEMGNVLKLDRFDNYYKTDDQGNQLPYLDGVDIQPIPEAATLINALRTGEVDFAQSIPRAQVNTIMGAQGVKVKSSPPAGWNAVHMNNIREPFNRKKVRQAVAAAVDQKAFVEDAYLGHAHPAMGPIPPAHGKFYRENKPNAKYQEHNPERAKRLIQEAGEMNRKVKLKVPQNETRQGRVMVDQLDTIFDVELNAVPGSVFVPDLSAKEHDYDIAIGGASSDLAIDGWMREEFLPPEELKGVERSGGIYNETMFYDKKVYKWIKEARSSASYEKRKKLFWKAEDRIMKIAPVAFLNHQKYFQGWRNKVKGYDPHLVDRDLADVWISDE